MGETLQPAVPSGIQKTRSVMWAQEAELVWSCWRGKCCLVSKPSATSNCSEPLLPEVGCSSPKKLSSLLTQRSIICQDPNDTCSTLYGRLTVCCVRLSYLLTHAHHPFAFLPSNNFKCFSFKRFSSIMSERLSSAVMAVPVMIVIFKR